MVSRIYIILGLHNQKLKKEHFGWKEITVKGYNYSRKKSGHIGVNFRIHEREKCVVP